MRRLGYTSMAKLARAEKSAHQIEKGFTRQQQVEATTVGAVQDPSTLTGWRRGILMADDDPLAARHGDLLVRMVYANKDAAPIYVTYAGQGSVWRDVDTGLRPQGNTEQWIEGSVWKWRRERRRREQERARLIEAGAKPEEFRPFGPEVLDDELRALLGEDAP